MNAQAKFHELVAEAHDAMVQFDEFDLVSGNPESERVWAEILANVNKRSRDLIDYVTSNADALRGKMK